MMQKKAENGEQGREADESKNELESVLFTLINDGFDLLPDELESQVIKEGNITPVMEAALAFNPKIGEISFSVTPFHFGIQASYVIYNIFGENPSNVVAPQSIYYEGSPEETNFGIYLERGKANLTTSNNADRDKYNLALNLLLKLWLKNFSDTGTQISSPKEGVYLRNSNDRLYSYEEVKK